jgi:hypothetical protein
VFLSFKDLSERQVFFLRYGLVSQAIPMQTPVDHLHLVLPPAALPFGGANLRAAPLRVVRPYFLRQMFSSLN